MGRNNVTLKQLRAFIAVADKGSFIAASEALARSQPALSQLIRQLEDEIGSPLFHRTTRSVRLTTLGMSLLPTARHLLAQIDAAVEDIQEAAAEKRGRVIVACLPSIAYRIMPQVIAVSEAMHPKMRVIVRDLNLRGIVAAVSDDQADIGIASIPLAGSALDGLALARDRFYAIFPGAHPLARRSAVQWKDLAGYPFISMTTDNGIRQMVDDIMAAQDVRLSIVSEVSNLATLYGLLEAGIGVTALPGLALPADNHPFLAVRTLRKPTVERTIRIVWRPGVGLSQSGHAIVEAIRAALAQGRLPNDGKRVTWSEAMLRPAPTKARRPTRPNAAIA
jgi:DNA-binding transcriptional LysR family regulator